MSKADLVFLERLRISPARVASHLGLSRQAVYAGIAKEKPYFDTQRRRQLRQSLMTSDVKSERGLAEHVDIEGAEDAQSPEAGRSFNKSGGFVRLVISPSPSEATYPEALDGIVSRDLLDWAIICYVLADRQKADMFGAAIRSRVKRGGEFPAHLAIFESNVATAMPDSTIVCSHSGVWSGHYNGRDGNGASYDAEYLARIRMLFAAAGFGFGSVDESQLRYPSTEVFGHSGFEFRCRFDSRRQVK